MHIQHTRRTQLSVALIVVAGLLGLATPASAATAHLSMFEAHRLVIQRVGPGTVVGHCNRHSATRITCAYTTPAINVGIEVNENEAAAGAVFESWITV